MNNIHQQKFIENKKKKNRNQGNILRIQELTNQEILYLHTRRTGSSIKFGKKRGLEAFS